MSDSRESGGWFALGVMLGAGVGAAIGLLFAPRPGADTRRDFAEKSDDLRRRATEAGAAADPIPSPDEPPTEPASGEAQL